jgi:hypothetical protein
VPAEREHATAGLQKATDKNAMDRILVNKSAPSSYAERTARASEIGMLVSFVGIFPTKSSN